MDDFISWVDKKCSFFCDGGTEKKIKLKLVVDNTKNNTKNNIEKTGGTKNEKYYNSRTDRKK